MGIEKKVVSGKVDPDVAEFLAWLSKQGDDGYGITVSTVINRIGNFMRDVYIVGQCAMGATAWQVLLRKHGLPQLKEVEGAGLLTSEVQQTRFHFFSRPNRAAVREELEAYRPSFLGGSVRLFFAHVSTRRAA